VGEAIQSDSIPECRDYGVLGKNLAERLRAPASVESLVRYERVSLW
jgi:hypothetical protein